MACFDDLKFVVRLICNCKGIARIAISYPRKDARIPAKLSA